jgi:hypothetical protein
MPEDEIMLDDDFVASLLARDAKESSIKYSALGLEAFNKVCHAATTLLPANLKQTSGQ